MDNSSHLNILKQGVERWNELRKQHPDLEPDFRGVDLSNASLVGANLFKARLSRADLRSSDLRDAYLSEADLLGADARRADFSRANLLEANLRQVNFGEANLSEANLEAADLRGAILDRARLPKAHLRLALLNGASLEYADAREANLNAANLRLANFREADLRGANLNSAILVQTGFAGAKLTGCRVYGVSAWDLRLEGAEQTGLVISRGSEPLITVDDLEVAQFIRLLLNNEKLRRVIDTLTSKAVLILGRFTPERKAVLDAIRDELRRQDLLPVVFDFERPVSRDYTETVSTLAHMSRFIIADLTEARGIPQELQSIVPDLPSVPVQPLLEAGSTEYAMFEHFRSYPWVLEPYQYDDSGSLIASLAVDVVAPALQKATELQRLSR
jgi:uncharacterized protein YjbI with pentapeptide repeats